MTPKEKAEEAWNDYEYREGNLYSNCFKDGFKQGAKIADDYAIEFAEWLKESGFIIELIKGSRQTKKILEIFKKEKGL